MPNPAPAINALKQAMQARQEALAATQPTLPQPVGTPAAPQREEMTPAMRALFAQQTGIAANPAARDIQLGPDPEELKRRADALINRYGGM